MREPQLPTPIETRRPLPSSPSSGRTSPCRNNRPHPRGALSSCRFARHFENFSLPSLTDSRCRPAGTCRGIVRTCRATAGLERQWRTMCALSDTFTVSPPSHSRLGACTAVRIRSAEAEGKFAMTRQYATQGEQSAMSTQHHLRVWSNAGTIRSRSKAPPSLCSCAVHSWFLELRRTGFPPPRRPRHRMNWPRMLTMPYAPSN